MRILICCLSIGMFVAAMPVRAELPLNIEGILTDKGKVKLEFVASYSNLESSKLSVGNEVLVVQTGTTSFVTVPTNVGERTINGDAFVGTAGLRYGLTGRAEIYTRTNYLYSRQRSIDADGTKDSNSLKRWASTWGGINYRFKDDNKTPAILGFAEVALYEKHTKSRSSFKSAMMGFTTYKAIDPVVLSLTGAYLFSGKRKDGDFDYKPGNLTLVSPSVAFAVNDRITLTTGVQWVNRMAERVDKQEQGMRNTSTDLILGVGYGVSKSNTLNLTLQPNVSGRGGADLRFNWLYTL
ncbi:MAG: hypothetical protein FWH56_05975 [Betaproteobacteria bacterium]|nr:hypothetical protein [Betaproteobacteria bacterium]